MKLKSIKLCNFRQFYGLTPEIQFAGSDRNITIVHGNNGAGKTTLLNAFTWVLYEKFTAAFASPDRLANKRAISEVETGRSVECFVELAFDRDNKRYRVKRRCRAYNHSSGIEYGKSELSMWVAGDDGRWMLTHKNPEEIVERILPGSLHQYFFFDGERIEHIVRDDKREEIATATKELLGLEVFNRSVTHLKVAKKTLELELENIGDPQTKKILHEKVELEREGDRLSQHQEEIARELASHRELKTTISSRLLELSGAKQLQDKWEALQAREKSLREQLIQAKEVEKQAISRKGQAIFLPEITVEFRRVVDELRQKGELPTGIKQQFVMDLLNQKRCICGADLLEGTHAFHSVQAWMEKAGMADIEETAIRTIAKVDELDKQALEFWEVVDRQEASINQWRSQLASVESELDSLKEKLRSYPNEDIQQLQKRLDEIESKISELERETGANQHQIETVQSEIDRKSKQVAKQKMNEEKQALAQRRIQATQEAIERITEVKNRLDKQFRWQLERQVQEIFKSISFTPYVPKLSDKYELTLVDKTTLFESPVAASTGENQILSLSFIGGIIDRVREWSQTKMHLGPDSSTFPIVMDSPFGSLDEIYRRQVAKSIPQLANQLVVLVTKTQWRGEVEAEMASRIGKEYVLVYNSPKIDCEEDSIQLGKVSYPLVRKSANEFEYTEIIEVARHGF